MFKRSIALALLAATTLFAAPAHAADKIKVGLLVTGSTSDGGWNQLAGDAINRLAKKDPDIEVSVRQQVSKDAAPDAVRQFDAKGYNLVIGHGFEYQDVAKEITTGDNPVSVKIAVSGGDADDPHFQSLDYGLYGPSYQLGIIAAKVSKSGKLGFIAGEPFSTIKAMKRGFEAGAKSVNPNATVVDQYTGWDDPSKAKKQAEAFMQQGVDVIMQDVDAASRGVFEAVKEHNSAGAAHSTVYTFGANSDQNANPVCPEYTLASAVINLDIAFSLVIDQIKNNTFKGGLIKEDLPSGVSLAILNPKLVGTIIDADTQKLITDAGKKITSGEIKIPDADK